MSRKQTRQPSRKRLWFNVVEFDKETGRPLWRNKKSKLDNTLPSCITDPKFAALFEKLRKETAENARSNETLNSSAPFSPVWKLNKYKVNPRSSTDVQPSSLIQSNNRGNSRYEDESSPKLVMRFQHFSPLDETQSLENSKMEKQKIQIQELLKMKSAQPSSTFHPYAIHSEQGHMGRDKTTKKDVPCGMTSVLPSEWGMNNTVRLHHLDMENPLTIY